MKEMYKVAAVVIDVNKFLMVRKKGKDIWTNLGGKPEEGETEKEVLKREVMEELGCKCIIKEKIGNFQNKAALDDAIINISFYLTELVGNPKIVDDELEEFAYIGSDYKEQGIKLPLSITEQLIPLLISKNYLKWERK